MFRKKKLDSLERRELQQLRKEKLDRLHKDVEVLKKLFGAHEKAFKILIQKIDDMDIQEIEIDDEMDKEIDEVINKQKEKNEIDMYG